MNYRMIASDVWSTAEAVAKIEGASGQRVNVSGASHASVSGYGAVAFFSGSTPVSGSPFMTHTYQGVTFFFSAKQNKATFAAAPNTDVPQCGGFRAYGVSIGKLLPLGVSAAQVRDGKLSLNLRPAIRITCDADFATTVAKKHESYPWVQEKKAKERSAGCGQR